MTQHRLPPPAIVRKRIKPIDFLIIGVVISVVVFVFYRVEHVLVYDWSWGEIFEYVISWDEETGTLVPNLLLKGLAMTLRLAFWGTIAAAIIGLVMGLCRTSTNLFLRTAARLYVELIRNIPPLVFIFVFYFFISSQIMPILGIDDFTSNPPPDLVPILEILFGPIGLFNNFLSGAIVLAMFEGGLHHRDRPRRRAIHTQGAMGSGARRGAVPVQRIEGCDPAPGAAQYPPSPGGAVHFAGQGFLYRGADLHSGVDLPDHGSFQHHDPLLRGLDHHRAHVLHGLLFLGRPVCQVGKEDAGKRMALIPADGRT
jgi:His/Glu/Gln/Arg/opine family amino acid ABC transporter permease subunit